MNKKAIFRGKEKQQNLRKAQNLKGTGTQGVGERDQNGEGRGKCRARKKRDRGNHGGRGREKREKEKQIWGSWNIVYSCSKVARALSTSFSLSLSLFPLLLYSPALLSEQRHRLALRGDKDSCSQATTTSHVNSGRIFFFCGSALADASITPLPAKRF